MGRCNDCGNWSEDIVDGLCPDCLEDRWEQMTEDIVMFDPDPLFEMKKKERILRQFPLWEEDEDKNSTEEDDTIALLLLYAILVVLIGVVFYFIVLPVL